MEYESDRPLIIEVQQKLYWNDQIYDNSEWGWVDDDGEAESQPVERRATG